MPLTLGPFRPPVEREKLGFSALPAHCARTPIQTQLTCSAPSTRPFACSSRRRRVRGLPPLLAAIGGELGSDGALWLPAIDGRLHCAPASPTGAAAAAELAAACGSRAPARRAGPPAAFTFPLPGVGIMGFSTAAPLVPDANLLATMDSLGPQISQFVERCRAQAAVRESDARKSAILNAAFDCIITMDHHGNVVEVNRAAERTFGYRAERMIGASSPS